MKKKLVSLLTAVTLALSLTACGNASSNETKGNTSTETSKIEESGTADAEKESEKDEHVTIRLADQSVNMVLYFHYAQELGILDKYFKDYDVDFEISDFASGPAVNEAIAAGQLDFSMEGNLPSVTGPISGYGTEVIAISSVSSRSIGAIATPIDTDIYTLEDTKGRTVGTAIGTAYHYTLARFYDAAGVSLDDVNLINAGTDVTSALRAGEIDAGYVSLAQAAILEEENSVRVISDELIVTAPVHYFIASKDFAKAHPELTATLLKAIAETEEAILADPDAFGKYYDEYLGTDASAYVTTLLSSDMGLTRVNDLAVNEIEQILSWLDKNGLADTDGKTADDVYDNTYADLAGLSD